MFYNYVKILNLMTLLDKQQDGIGEKVKALKREADRTIEEFNAQYDINPVIFVNIVLKF